MKEMGVMRAVISSVKSFIHNNLPAPIKPHITRSFLDRKNLIAARNGAEYYRIKQGLPHEITFFHQLNDPYSVVAVQTIPSLLDRYNVNINICLVNSSESQYTPQYDKLVNLSRKDAQLLAWRYSLEFTDPGAQPSDEAVRRAQLASLPHAAFVGKSRDDARSVAVISQELWRNTKKDHHHEEKIPKAEVETVPPMSGGLREHIDEAEGLRRDLGYYMGGSFYYGGEWYWGVDRLYHLEERLCELRALRGEFSAAFETKSVSEPAPQQPQQPLATTPTLLFPQGDQVPASRATGPMPAMPVPDLSLAGAAARTMRSTAPAIDFFFSFRSPYSAISVERVFALGKKLDVEVRLRYVLPMVMRGLPVPEAKQLYIIKDVAREAHVRGIPFGFARDPVGSGVERGLCLIPHAQERGREQQFVTSFMKLVWSEAVDAASDSGLRKIVEHAGLNWPECQAVLQHAREDEAAGRTVTWREQAEKNRSDLFKCGLWGVPSFQVNDFAVFGQDRLWAVEEAVRVELKHYHGHKKTRKEV